MTEDENEFEEIQIKRRLLRLELDKFEYTKESELKSRLCMLWMSGARALLLAHGSAIFFSITYRDTIVRIFTSDIADLEMIIFLGGIMTAIVVYCEGLYISTWSYDGGKLKPFGKRSFPSAKMAMISLMLIFIGVFIPLFHITNPEAIPRAKAWISSIITKR